MEIHGEGGTIRFSGSTVLQFTVYGLRFTVYGGEKKLQTGKFLFIMQKGRKRL